MDINEEQTILNALVFHANYIMSIAKKRQAEVQAKIDEQKKQKDE